MPDRSSHSTSRSAADWSALRSEHERLVGGRVLEDEVPVRTGAPRWPTRHLPGRQPRWLPARQRTQVPDRADDTSAL